MKDFLTPGHLPDTQPDDAPPKQSAGILLYNQGPLGPLVMLGHMGGPAWKGKHIGAWTVPKGKLDQGESPFAAALREFEEEVGFKPEGDFIPLTTIVQKSGKRVHTWAVKGDFEPARIRSNQTYMEWPAGSGTTMYFPELDRVAWFTLEEAERVVVKGQAPLFQEIGRILYLRGAAWTSVLLAGHDS